MDKEDFDWWHNFKTNLRNTVDDAEYRKVSELHAKYYDHIVNYPCKCEPSVLQLYIDELNIIYANNS